MAQKKLPWFRIYTNNTAALNGIDNDKLGAALKAVMEYFNRGGLDNDIEKSIADPITRIAFALLKQGADDSIEEHNARIEDGKKGAAAKRQKETQMQQQINMYVQKYGGNEPEPAPAADFVILPDDNDETMPFN